MRPRWHCWLPRLLPGTIPHSTVILYDVMLYNVILHDLDVTLCNVILPNIILQNISVILYNTATPTIKITPQLLTVLQDSSSSSQTSPTINDTVAILTIDVYCIAGYQS